MNEETDFYDSAPDIHPFEIRSEQLWLEMKEIDLKNYCDTLNNNNEIWNCVRLLSSEPRTRTYYVWVPTWL